MTPPIEIDTFGIAVNHERVDVRYFVRNELGEEFGPFSSNDLRALARQNRLGAGDFVRREIGETWHPFTTIPGLGCDRPAPEDAKDVSDVDSLMQATVEGWDAKQLPDVEAADPPSLVDAIEMTRDRADDRENPRPPERLSKVGSPVRPTRTSIRPSPPAAHDAPASMPEPIATPRPAPIVDMVPTRVDTPTVNAEPDDPPHGVQIRESPGDAMRRSWLAGLLGRRAILHLLPGRIDLVTPSLTGSHTQACWLDAIDAVSIKRRRAWFRTLLGAVLIIGAIMGGIGTMIDVGWAPLPGAWLPTLLAAACLLLLGLGLIAFSTSRVLEIHAGSQTLRIHSSGMGSNALEWIDDARRKVTSVSSGGIHSSNSSSESISTRS